jgi:glycosyltransferase involved in cell wall biosynthesis
MAHRPFDRVFVIGAYLPNGGTLMAYHIGRILERDFGVRSVAVKLGSEGFDDGIHTYDLRMPGVTVAEMESQITPRDLLVVNPSFSAHQFGWRLPGTKISYVQDFKTFALLDRKIDHYIAVSDFVRDFLRTVYALDVPVIPPFIELDAMPAAPAWSQRPETHVLPYRKGIGEVWDLSFARVRQIVAERAPHIVFDDALPSSGIAHRELMTHLGATRFFLTLSAAEGFGLVPLEAMAMGATVIGYDGFSGRHYMRDDENCRVAPYPEIERVADMLIDAIVSPARSEAIAQRGRETARQYSYARFRRAWIEALSLLLAIEPVA